MKKLYKELLAWLYTPHTFATIVIILLAVLLVLWSPLGRAIECTLYEDCRYEAQPMRNSAGNYIRPVAVYNAFVKIHPCPSTGSKVYADGCIGWAINHPIPRACGGIHAVWNMQWIPDDVKHTIGDHAIDSFERKIYAFDPPKIDTPTCRNKIVK